MESRDIHCREGAISEGVGSDGVWTYLLWRWSLAVDRERARGVGSDREAELGN